jgi:predicted DNA-binding transcriptional regulator AlpA
MHHSPERGGGKPQRFLTSDELRAMGIDFSRQHLNRLIDAGRFPQPYRFGGGRNARKYWDAAEIAEFVRQRDAERPRARPRIFLRRPTA